MVFITESFSAISPRITFISSRQQLRFSVNQSDRLSFETTSGQLLGCVAQSSGSPLTYQWSHSQLPTDKPPLISQGSFLLIQHQSTTESKLRALLSGRLYCEARSASGADRKTTELQLLHPLRLTLEPNVQVIKSGQKGSFNCTVQGEFTSVHWFHNGRLLASSDSGHPYSQHVSVQLMPKSKEFPADSSSSIALSELQPLGQTIASSLNSINDGYVSILKLRQLRREHAGIYQCIVRAGQHSAQESSRLLIEDQPPRLLEVFTEHQTGLGTSHSLKCMASGNPLPQIGWLLDEQSLDGAAPPAMLGSDWQSQNAAAVMSSDSATSSVTTNLLQSTNTVDASVSSVLNSILSSSRNNAAISGQLLSQLRVGDYVTADNLVVSFVNISQIHSAHGGMYRCIAYSELGVASHQAELRVLAPKPFVRQMGVKRRLAGSSINVRCPASGWPIRQILWFRGKQNQYLTNLVYK